MDVVASAVKGGATMVQLRHKDADTRELLEEARELKAILDPQGVPLLINDRADVALAARAAGVHVGQSDLPAIDARRILGPDAIIGLTVKTLEQVREAETLDVDYLGVGPVYPSPTKPDAGQALGPEGLRAFVQATRLPVVAIGGIGLENAKDVHACGVAGIAVVSAISAAGDPGAAARGLLACIV
ncbi:MAG: thiamine phosphate synthase [Thermodesulfobacteriota bacterium]